MNYVLCIKNVVYLWHKINEKFLDDGNNIDI